MSEPIKQRPPQVTMASGLVVVSSVVVVLTAWSQVAALGSLETQEAVRAAVADPPFASLGVDADGLTAIVRVLAMVSAVAACATGILGWYVRRPDRGARLGLTVFAVPVFLAGLPGAWLPSTGIAGSFVAAGAAMLWLVPAREWFATGRWTPPAPRTPAPSPRDAAQQTGQQTGPRPGPFGPAGSPDPRSEQPPPAARPYGQPGPAPSWTPQPYAQPHPAPRPVLQRPGAVVTAFVLTVVVAGGMLTLSLLWAALVSFSPDLLMSMIEDQRPDLVDGGTTLGEVRGAVLGVSGTFIVWCTVALVLAGYLMARRDWARRALLVLAVVSAGGSIALAAVSPVMVLPGAAAVAVVLCLRRGDVRRWSSPDAR